MPKYTPKAKPIIKRVEEIEAETVHVVVPKEEIIHQDPIVPTKLFPLNFIQVPLGTFGLDNAEPVVHPAYKKLLDETLVNYKFHSFVVSSGMFIIAFEIR